MRTFSDASGNGMGVGFTKQAFLEELLNTDNLTSEAARVVGNFNASIRGTFVGTLVLERSLDDGVTYQVLSAAGIEFSYTDEMTETFFEPETHALYRWRFSAFTSGSAIVRIGK
jgi:hypothetical protein